MKRKPSWARRASRASVLAALTLAAAGSGSAAAQPLPPPSPSIAYETFFQDPATPEGAYALERHVIELIDATPAGEHIGFTLRDFNRRPVAQALIAAHDRDVAIDGVIDGGERRRAVVKELQAVLGPEHFVFCGSDSGFTFNSCMANSLVPSLMHNKFFLFSKLGDGRDHVVVQTSQNFFEPEQYGVYNDMVEIDGDVALYDAYGAFLSDLQAQRRTDDYYDPRSGDDRRNTIFQSPRRDGDTIVDRLREVDCRVGGSADGHGLIRIAQLQFRTERSAILDELLRLQGEGCDIAMVVSTTSPDIVARIAAAGIPLRPFLLKAIEGRRPDTFVHDKLWTVDAGSMVTGGRIKVVYAGSSNWRFDEQRSDDLLLRMFDDRVYADYMAYWQLLHDRADFDPVRTLDETGVPATALTTSPSPNADGWNRTPVTVRVAGSDGYLRGNGVSGLKALRIAFSGDETGSWEVLGEEQGVRVQEQVVSADGVTTVTHEAEDNAGNRSAPQSTEVRIDRLPPLIAGLPRPCRIWPPDHRLVHVATVTASDDPSRTDRTSGLAALTVTATGSGKARADDVRVVGGDVWVRAELRPWRRQLRSYRIDAVATDHAGNRTDASATCTVRPPGSGRPWTRLHGHGHGRAVRATPRP